MNLKQFTGLMCGLIAVSSVAFAKEAVQANRKVAESSVIVERLGDATVTSALIGNTETSFRMIQIVDESRKVVCYGLRDRLTPDRTNSNDRANALSSALQCVKF